MKNGCTSTVQEPGMSPDIQIIELPEKQSDDRMCKVSITLRKDKMPKLYDFMGGDSWEKAQVVRDANLVDCIKSLQIALNWALKHDTSGARVFATLLGSMYNGQRVKFDASDLRLLDAVNFEHALNCMRLCQEMHREPHTFFVNGGALFERFIKDWKLDKKARAA